MGSDTRSVGRSSVGRTSILSKLTSILSGSGERQQWANPVEFILTLVGYAVGLGNVWRFPYLAFENGGGAFLIPYFLMLLFVGMPVFYLEVCLGQFASLGPIAVWTLNPLLKGLGVAMVITNTMIAGYYCVIISWCMFYFFASMTTELPWATCDNWWNSDLCVTPDIAANISGRNVTLGNITYQPEDLQTAAEEYYYNYVLRMTGGLDDMGGIVWQLACCLLIAWIIVFFVLFRGIGSLGKVVYFSSLFPYVIMTIMVIRGCTLPGASVGIDFYLLPDWNKLMEAQVWSDAATQIFYSLSACSGGLLAMASYNDFHNNVLRDSILVPLINCFTSFFAGFAIFSVLGFMAEQKGVSVEDVAASGPGLVFVVYPEGLQQMPVAPLWSVLFFFMMLNLGFSSVFSMSECLFSAIIDEFPETIGKHRNRCIMLRLVGCALFFCFGLMMITEGGFYLFNIIDSFTGGFPLLFVGLFEFIGVSYIYGYFRFAKDVKMMLGRTPGWYFAAMWMVISPLLLLAVIVFLALTYAPLTLFDDTYEYPGWGQWIGWTVVILCIGPIPVNFIIVYCMSGGAKVLVDEGQPTEAWGPALAKNRKDTSYDRSGPRSFEKVEYTDASGHPRDDLGRIGQYTSVRDGSLGGVENQGFVEYKDHLPHHNAQPFPDYQTDQLTAF